MDVTRGRTPHVVSRDGHRPVGIVVHTNDGSFGGTVEWFGRGESGVSAHYLVGLDGRMMQFVNEEEGAKHAGVVVRPTAAFVMNGPDPNRYTIGIEFEDGKDPEGVERPDQQYASGGKLLRSVAERWGIPLDRDHVVGHREINVDKSCPGNLDIDRLLREAREPSTILAVLVPVRNGEEDLPDWLAHVATFADAVVALDDGSTDRTREILEASALVKILLTNPPRDTYTKWDDAENRNRLLEAAGDLAPGWLLFLDADERIDPDDARVLREFLEGDALPGCAYGLQHFRMWGSDRFVPEPRWVYRLFSHQEGLEVSGDRLHFNPVPEDIPQEAWLRTTIRLKHYAASTEERRMARLEKYAEADPDGEYETNFGGLAEPVEGDLPVWGPRNPDLPLLLGPQDVGPDLIPEAGEPRDQDGGPAVGGPTIAVLLPVRNGEDDLPGWLESVGRFADAVVALDDGSTDRTREILQESPLVKVLLTNPVRDSYAGWDDAANRNRLLAAAGTLRPRWILSLDTDERIDQADGAALRAFVEGGARRDLAYGFRVFRMLRDLDHYDRSDLWVCRLFAWREDLSFPARRLHFVPVPDDIPRSRWARTTLRIQHLAGLTEGRRRERFEKYLAADPGRTFQADYTHLLAPPGEIRRWLVRPPGLPALPDAETRKRLKDLELEELDLEGPLLSVVVISRDDEATIERTVRAVVEQECPDPFEVIVVTSGTDRTAAIVRDRFPDVTVVELDHPALPGEARNAGLGVARGDYISFPGSHVELPPGSLAARIRAHELGYPLVTGTVLNATDTPAGWASYFLDHSQVLPGRPSEELRGAPAHCSYARDFLLQVGGFPEDMRAGEDTVVNTRLARLGLKAYRAQEVRLRHRSPCRTPDDLRRHHFQRGRALGRIVLEEHASPRPLLGRNTLGRLLIGYLPRRVSRTSRNVRRWGDGLRAQYRRVWPLVVQGAASAWAGSWYELLRPAPGKLRRLVGRRELTLVVAGLDARPPRDAGRADTVLLAHLDLLDGRLRLVSLPRDLLVDVPGWGRRRLNEAYHVGTRGGSDPDRAGMRLLGATIERALDVTIDGWVALDFDGFRSFIDALQGIEIDVPHDIDDDVAGAHVRAGRQRLDGEGALAYVRTRMSDGEAWRRRRHLQVAEAILRRARGIRSASDATRVLAAARAAFRTSLGPGAILAAFQALLRSRGRVETSVLEKPLVRSVRGEGEKWVHTGDLGAVGAYLRLLLGSRPAGEAATPVR